MRKVLLAAATLTFIGLAGVAHAGLNTYNGSALNGFSLNGTRLNGITWNGTRLNGFTYNGTRVNGVEARGAEASDLSYGQVLGIELPQREGR